MFFSAESVLFSVNTCDAPLTFTLLGNTCASARKHHKTTISRFILNKIESYSHSLHLMAIVHQMISERSSTAIYVGIFDLSIKVRLELLMWHFFFFAKYL